jgi:hypothetical protein
VRSSFCSPIIPLPIPSPSLHCPSVRSRNDGKGMMAKE